MDLRFRRVAPTAAALLVLLLGSAPQVRAAESRWEGAVGLLAGVKFLDGADWRPAHTQAELGVRTDIGRSGWPVAIAADLLHSMARGSADVFLLGNLVRVRTDILASTTEVDLGVRKTWAGHPRFRPSLGAGVALVAARWRPRVAGYSFPREDRGAGGWLSGGISWLVTENLSIGAEARWSTAPVRVGGSETDAGGTHAALVAGWRW